MTLTCNLLKIFPAKDNRQSMLVSTRSIHLTECEQEIVYNCNAGLSRMSRRYNN